MDQADEERKRRQVQGEILDQSLPAADEPAPVEVTAGELDEGMDNLPPAGIDPAENDAAEDRVTVDDDLAIPDGLIETPPAPKERDPNEPDTSQRPSAPIPGAAPSLRPGSGGGESRFNDPGAIKSHIHDLEHVAPRERAAALAAEQAEAKAAEERQMHDQAEQLERDKSTQPLSPEDQARYFGAEDPAAAVEPAAETPQDQEAPAANGEQPPAPPAASADPAADPATQAEEPQRADARDLARAYRGESRGDSGVTQAHSRSEPAPTDARELARSYREAEAAKPDSTKPEPSAQPRTGIDID